MSTTSLPLLLQALPDAKPGATAESRALLGEAAAWDELIRRHSRKVSMTLLARGIRADTVRDLAQEAWMRIIEQQRLGRLDSLSLPALVIKQALFLARDHGRRGDARFQHIPLEDTVGGGDAEAHLIARDSLDRARAILTRCSPSEQQVFRAIYARPGASSAEVAAETGLSVQRIRQIVCEVRKKLRANMEAPNA